MCRMYWNLGASTSWNPQGLTPHPFLVPWSRKGRAIPLLSLWAVRPVGLYRASVPVQGWPLPLLTQIAFKVPLKCIPDREIKSICCAKFADCCEFWLLGLKWRHEKRSVSKICVFWECKNLLESFQHARCSLKANVSAVMSKGHARGSQLCGMCSNWNGLCLYGTRLVGWFNLSAPEFYI
jgi:hypothetical protein